MSYYPDGMTRREIDQMEGGNCIERDVWCDDCLCGYNDILICLDGDYGEGECPEGHLIEMTFEKGDL